MARRWARKFERFCCSCCSYFPLVFVYGITSWAVWVLCVLCTTPSRVSGLGWSTALGGVFLYCMLNWCYTKAVFTPPGSTTNDNGYSVLPFSAPPTATSFTVKSDGQVRFCRKCQARKPDRAHHCSTCRRCVLKMDHHCPWLATCIGLRNHKPFLLFLVYTTLFSGYVFAASGAWVWVEIMSNTTYVETMMPVHYIMLCVIGGIIAIVVGAFTSWHLYLAAHGQTTIECLEKTRYLSPLRKTMQQAYDATHRAVTSARSQQSSNSEEEEEGGGLQLPKYGQQLLELHQNALPGITRPEEGEVLLDGDTPVPYRDEDADAGAGTLETQAGSRRLTYKELEQYRSRKRYEEYLDEQDSQKLPHAFDLGWRRNLAHLLGPSLWLWALPVCNTTGDGWTWEPSPRWLAARERLARERAQQRERERIAGWGPEDTPVGAGAGRHYLQAGMVSRQSHQPPTTRSAPSPTVGPTPPSKADRVLGRDPTMYVDEPPRQQHENVSLQRLSPAGQSLGQYGEESDDDADDDDDDNNNEELDHTGLFGRAGADPESRDLVRKQQMAAEQRALHVVTNGALGRGGALMRSAVPGPLRSPSTAGQDGRYDDDGVD